MNKGIFFLVVALFQGLTIQAQQSASATVSSRATIIDPITISKSVDLDFGNVISSSTPGTVTLSPEGTRVAYGAQISSSFPGNVAAAEAVVKHGNNSYSITLPESFTLYSQEDPSQTLVIDGFTVTPEEGEVSDILKIGATLNLQASQPSGFYTNTTGFNVTVSYN